MGYPPVQAHLPIVAHRAAGLLLGFCSSVQYRSMASTFQPISMSFGVAVASLAAALFRRWRQPTPSSTRSGLRPVLA